MIFSNPNDISRCIEIIGKELLKNNVNVNEEVLNKITLDIMNISYSKGADYLIRLFKAIFKCMLKKGFI